jgi:hypothetical protein
MQHDKITEKIGQIEKVSSTQEEIPLSITDGIDKFKLASSFRKIDFVKRSGILASTLSLYFLELLQIFANLTGKDFIAFYEDLLRNEEAGKIISKIGLGLTNSEYRDAA